MALNPLSAPDTQRLKDAIYERSEIRAHQARQWVSELVRVSGTIAAQGTAAGADTITAFWIRLFGVLSEVGESYEYVCKLADDCGASDTPLARDGRMVRDALRAMRDSMDEDELIWLHYRRDCECHVWQKSYELGRTKNGLKEKRGFDLLGGKELTVDDFAKRASAMLRKHGVNEPAMAVHFAKLVLPHAARVFEALRALS